MTADELLDKCIVYRKMMATHGLWRNLGFDAGDIYSFIGGNAGMQLETQGKEFTLRCCDELPRPYEEFKRDWQSIVEQAATISDVMLSRCKANWGTRDQYAGMLASLKAKGFKVPRLDEMLANVANRHKAEAEGKLQ